MSAADAGDAETRSITPHPRDTCVRTVSLSAPGARSRRRHRARSGSMPARNAATHERMPSVGGADGAPPDRSSSQRQQRFPRK